MKNEKGFTWIEALVSLNILFIIVVTIIPISTLIKQERTKLHDRRIISYQLHDELLHKLWEGEELSESVFSKTINDLIVKVNFTKEQSFIKGCAIWDNVKKQEEKICLYGYEEG